MVRPLAGLIAVVTLALVPACGDDGSPGAAATVELRATASRSTLFNTQRTFRLTLENLGEVTVPVTSVQLDSPRFEPVEPLVRDTELPAGSHLLMPLPYGDSVCAGDADGEHTLVVVVDGEEVRVPLGQDPEGVVDDLNEAECTDARIRSQVEVAFGDDWAPAGPRAARGVMRLDALEDGAVAEVDALAGNVVFGIEASSPRSPLLAVGADQDADEVGVVVSADRCDVHAMIESKRTFVYRATIRLGDEPPFELDVRPDDATHEVFEDLLHRCLAQTSSTGGSQ